MPPLTIQTKRFSVRADLPESVLTTLRKVRRAGRRDGQSSGSEEQRLVVHDRIPSVTAEVRDVRRSLAYFQAAQAQMVGGAGDGEAEELLPSDWDGADLAGAVAAAWWYHTIELPGVVTPGVYDHRPLLPHYDLPEDLHGSKVLDVATLDGFWAFEFERRGAEVVAADVPRIRDIDHPAAVRDMLIAEGIDWPTGRAFGVAHRALSSNVTRIERSVYDLDPADVGTFDLVHVSDLLLHLRDPMAALTAVAKVTGDRAIITDCFDPTVPAGLSRYAGGWSVATWWLPSLETLVQMVSDAGFRDVRIRGTFRLSTRDSPVAPWRVSLMATK